MKLNKRAFSNLLSKMKLRLKKWDLRIQMLILRLCFPSKAQSILSKEKVEYDVGFIDQRYEFKYINA